MELEVLHHGDARLAQASAGGISDDGDDDVDDDDDGDDDSGGGTSSWCSMGSSQCWRSVDLRIL